MVSKLSFILFLISLPTFKVQDDAGKFSLIYFSGSDWCVKCIQLEKQVLSNDAFISFLEEQSIQVEKIDFPQRKKLTEDQIEYNQTVADTYSFDGVFPTLLLGRTDTLKYIKLDYLNDPPVKLMEQISNKIDQLR